MASAWVLDDSCDKYNLKHEIEHAVQEAIDMARYALWRKDVDIDQNKGTLNIDTVAEQLVGGSWRDEFPEKMGKVAQTFGTFNGRWDIKNAARDTTVVIKCGNNIFQQDQKGWKDPQFAGGVRSQPCQGRTMAGTYDTFLGDTGEPAGPFKAILLCDALLTRIEPTIGKRWATTNWKGQWFNQLGRESWTQYLLHESMHAIHWPGGRNSPRHLSNTIDPGDPNDPSTRVGEKYGWQAIQPLPDSQKAMNADGYSLLAGILWMKDHGMSKDGKFLRRRPRKLRPRLDMPNDPHPPRSG